ncbi:uncharacterized protein L969DRAFT_90075 [Mixia osmundae IAM 14324]|uniref:Nucleosome assembly protein n=1 Tax=Mixia osmundae (strain CBS 9802 / IAM 14324 / JCM 22182 / KY 12970) TaxID=764103 RepID=G7EAX1_MIXOS|nr:uncharacterized protein L969DRAFT_90075 [Mixia osmundae IAM 14324]KEI37016.1 hypothetical protein L969DRAFT_90075 [Mixia osmundae IAM 14324]GAA99981.1 hypothetical protein E5Q_06684 [Mixia osmundae IAM 14324]
MTSAEDARQVKETTDALLKDAYAANYDKVIALKEELAKGHLESYKAKVKAQLPAYKQRIALTESIPKFWLTTLDNTPTFASVIDGGDRDALGRITDIWIDYGADPREYDVTFTFAPRNPYFKQSKLTKSFKIDREAAKAAGVGDYELEIPLKTTAVSIDWSDDKHNLVAKRPAPSVPSNGHSDDLTDDYGSFFNWFTQDTDVEQLGDSLVQMWENALDCFAGLNNDMGYDTSDDDDDDEGDDEGEIDIEDSEDEETKRAKKRARQSRR